MKIVCLLLFSVLLISSCAGPGVESHQSGSAAFAHSLGSARAQDSGARCSIGTSAPAGSPLKSQTINFVLERGDMSSWSTHEFPVATGASNSLAELQALLGDALRRGLSARAGTELVKVGDISHGGEVRLVARGGGAVDFVYQPVIEGGNPRLSPGETAAFAQLLGK
jgi:hypothetical protein